MSDSTESALITALQVATENALGEINTTLPGKIISVNGNRVVVQPTMPKQLASGDALDAPNVVEVPVVWPYAQAGKIGLTMPLRPGDGVLLVFAQRSLEGWLSGNAGAPDDPRRFDLSDAIAIPGLMSNAPAPSTNQLELFFNNAKLRFASNGVISLENANGQVSMQADGSCIYTGPKFTINADVQVNGKINTTGDVTAGTVSLQHHVHSNSGGQGTGGPPVG